MARRPPPPRRPSPPTEPLFNQALAALRKGAVEEARALCATGLARDPNRPDGWNLLGAIHRQGGQFQEAEAAYRRAITLLPAFPDPHNNLGNLHRDLGRNREALACYREALRLKPGWTEVAVQTILLAMKENLKELALALCETTLRQAPSIPELHYFRGNLLLEAKRLEEARACFQEALRLQPGLVDARINLGACLGEMGHWQDAVVVLYQALQQDPQSLEALLNLMSALNRSGRLEQADALCQLALSQRGEHPLLLRSLGDLRFKGGRYEQALAAYEKALELDPESIDARFGLGSCQYHQGRYREATDNLTRVIAARPDYMEAHNNLGNVHKNQGDNEAAIACYRRALALKPETASVHSNILLCLNYTPRVSRAELFEEHKRFDARHVQPLAAHIAPHANLPDPHRQLRVGYVSADFRRHAVSYYVEPVLAHHDHAAFQVVCYHNHPGEDDTTRRLKTCADLWRPCSEFSDASLAQRIREDGIDILVDLSGHSAMNRLLVFARKPAPVQVSWIGYPNTTGVSTIDYRLCDDFSEPPGMAEAWSVERLFRLPGSSGLYQAASHAPPPAARAPVFARGFITYGSFHNYAKITDLVLTTWARILLAVPSSRLLMESPGLGDDTTRSQVSRRFQELGIAPDRLTLLDRLPQNQYRLYQEVDICLDTFPYNGGTTSCDTVWMGVPFVTLAGESPSARIGLTVLGNVGLPELAAATPEEYLEKAVALGRDREWLVRCRERITRERLRHSLLFDGPAFVRNLEAAYREMWRRWCATREGQTP